MSKTILERFRLDGRVAPDHRSDKASAKRSRSHWETGAKAVIADINPALAETVHELKRRGLEALSVTTNVAESQSVPNAKSIV